MRKLFTEKQIGKIAKEAVGELGGCYGHFIHFNYVDDENWEYKIEFYDNFEGRYEVTDLENILSVAKAGTYVINEDGEIGPTIMITVPTGIACANFAQSGSTWSAGYKLLDWEEIRDFTDEEI